MSKRIRVTATWRQPVDTARLAAALLRLLADRDARPPEGEQPSPPAPEAGEPPDQEPTP